MLAIAILRRAPFPVDPSCEGGCLGCDQGDTKQPARRPHRQPSRWRVNRPRNSGRKYFHEASRDELRTFFPSYHSMRSNGFPVALASKLRCFSQGAGACDRLDKCSAELAPLPSSLPPPTRQPMAELKPHTMIACLRESSRKPVRWYDGRARTCIVQSIHLQYPAVCTPRLNPNPFFWSDHPGHGCGLRTPLRLL